MSIKRALRRSTPIILAGLIASPASATVLFDDVAEIRDRAPAGGTFNSELVKEYKEITLFEADQMYDWFDAENHATKGNMAAAGETPMPYEPANWNIESDVKLRELQLARAELVRLLDDGGRTMAPSEAATAQAKFDCWVEQQEEGHQPTHIAACREAYLTALDDLKSAMKPQATTTVIDEIAREVVYFDFDDATINGTAQAQLDEFVAEMSQIQPVVTLYIEGHADTSGPADYNANLSRERAEAVRNELVRQGMTIGDFEDLQMQAEGETDPAVATGDNVRERMNRRVEVSARGQKTVTVPASDQTASLTR